MKIQTLPINPDDLLAYTDDFEQRLWLPTILGSSDSIIPRNLGGTPLDIRTRAERVACAVLCAGSLLSARPSPAAEASLTAATEVRSAFLNGREVAFRPVPPPRGKRGLSVGPWQFGERIANPKPRDHRLNLYFVSPGTQQRFEGYAAYDHNEIINDIPDKDQPVEWDVYWAVVLDPSLQEEFKSENDLLMTTQREFSPGEDFEFNNIPGASFLESMLEIKSLDQLQKFRRPSGNLPQVMIVPAGFAVRASVQERPEPIPAQEEAIPGEEVAPDQTETTSSVQ